MAKGQEMDFEQIDLLACLFSGTKSKEQTSITGQIVGLEETKVTIQLKSGELKVYPRKELNISLQWVFDNMWQPVVCILKDGVVTDIRSIGGHKLV